MYVINDSKNIENLKFEKFLSFLDHFDGCSYYSRGAFIGTSVTTQMLVKNEKEKKSKKLKIRNSKKNDEDR